MERKVKGCCFAGPTRVPDKEVNRLAASIEETARRLAAQGELWFWAGGGLGFDTLAALTVLKLREQLPIVRLGLLLPGKDQAAGWHPANRAVYDVIRSRADAVEYAGEDMDAQSNARQQAALTARCAECIAWYPPEEGEPPLAARARQEGLDVILL